MHIFIDETGSFSGIASDVSLSLIGALVVPDSRRGSLEREYKRLRPSLPQENSEVKGRRMMEQHVAKVVSILRHHDALFEVVGIDLGSHTLEGLKNNQAERAAAMTNSLTPDHSPGAVEFAWSIRRGLESHSINLHVQSAMTFVLIKKVIEHATMYWGQRKPRELEYFHWVVDAKDVSNAPTAWEQWWSKVIMPWMQTDCHYNPILSIKAADYSFMERFHLKNPTPFQIELLKLGPDGPPPFDIKMVMTESFRFSSDPEAGLEMVDIITNATRRALIGNLQREGWKEIPRLIIDRQPQNIQLVSLDRNIPDKMKVRYAATLKQFDRSGRDMLTPKNRKNGW